jgi:DNA-directed RNA polymerase subunit RPC12/RpoP
MAKWYRRWICFQCRNEFETPVEVASGGTPNISGEKAVWCPRCNRRADSGSTAYIKIEELMAEVDKVVNSLNNVGAGEEYDPERDHHQADGILLEFIGALTHNSKIRDAFNKIPKWYA